MACIGLMIQIMNKVIITYVNIDVSHALAINLNEKKLFTSIQTSDIPLILIWCSIRTHGNSIVSLIRLWKFYFISK